MNTKIYFASDFHLGIEGKTSSLAREKHIIDWLEQVSADASEIYLIGDIFDFWFEYKTVVPKGFTRFLGKLAQLKDRGIQIEIFTGNHDMWMFKYLTEEMNIPVHKAPIERTWNGHKFIIGHGDGLGPGDHGYKFIKKVFANPVCQFLFRWLHPDIGMSLANYWSRRSRLKEMNPPPFKGPDKEWLVQYCESVLQQEFVDYFIFGHRHLAIDYLLSNQKSRYINVGDWLQWNTYAVFDGAELELKSFPIAT